MDPRPIPPPTGSGDTPELYKLPGLKFQALCRDLLDSGADPEISSCREYGVNGQQQHGIDLIADRKTGGIDVGQCKGVRDFPPAKIRKACAEFLEHVDLWKSRDVRRFIVLVGSEVRPSNRRCCVRDRNRTTEWTPSIVSLLLKVDPLYAALRSDPRFGELLAQMNLQHQTAGEFCD